MDDGRAFHENLYGQEAGELQPLYLQGKCKQVFGVRGLLF